VVEHSIGQNEIKGARQRKVPNVSLNQADIRDVSVNLGEERGHRREVNPPNLSMWG
jgi:hypothetical protein